jgi:hypothetical protein
MNPKSSTDDGPTYQCGGDPKPGIVVDRSSSWFVEKEGVLGCEMFGHSRSLLARSPSPSPPRQTRAQRSFDGFELDSSSPSSRV